MKLQELEGRITDELKDVLGKTNEGEIEKLVTDILGARRIFLYGLGRVLLMAKAFAMRLVHLGLTAYVVGEVTTPSVTEGDLLIICSGSGETDVTVVLAEKARKVGVRSVLITAHRHSRIAKLVGSVVEIPAQTKLAKEGEVSSVQPMATLFEQSLLLFFDMLVVLAMDKLHLDSQQMWKRHYNLE